MPIQQEQGRVLNGGLVTGVPPHAIGRLESPDLLNIDPADPLGATTRPGSSQYGIDEPDGDASGFLSYGLFPWTRNAGTTYLFAGYGTTIYALTSASWTSVKTGVGTDSVMQGAALNNVAVLVASGIAPQVSTSGSTLEVLGTGAGGFTNYQPSLAKYVTTYGRKIILAGDPNNPNRISWSSADAPENWTDENDPGEEDVFKDDGDVIQGIQGTKRALYVFKRKHTYALTGILSVGDVSGLGVDLLCGWGLVSERHAYASDGNGCFFASDDGIYYAVGLNVSRISDPIRQTYLDISDKSTITMEVKGEKLFVFYAGSGSSLNNRALVLAFKRMMSDGSVRGVWSIYDSQPYGAAMTGRDTTLYGLTNTSTAQVWKLDTGTSATVTAQWNTPDMDFGEMAADKTLMRYFVHMKPPNATTTLTVRAFVDGASVGSDYTFTIGTSGSHVIDQAAGQSRNRIVGKHMRLRLEWDGQMTVYGFKVYADVRSDDVPRR